MRLPAPLLRSNKTAHKNDFGHVLVIAGSPAMLGAAALTGLAAMRSGAGLTTIAIAKSLNLALQKKISNTIMTLPLQETNRGTISLKSYPALKSLWTRYSVLAIGPGMTQNPNTGRFITKIYQECPLPMVVDADALNALAGKMGQIGKVKAPRILTPHPKEMSRLTGLSCEEIQHDRKGIARKYAMAWGATIVLKGYRTVVASPEGKTYVNTTGNAALATAGSGDVLTGIIAGLAARGKGNLFKTVCFSVSWHGTIGDVLNRGRKGFAVIATDILEGLRPA